jgi:hypothetical protein
MLPDRYPLLCSSIDTSEAVAALDHRQALLKAWTIMVLSVIDNLSLLA